MERRILLLCILFRGKFTGLPFKDPDPNPDSWFEFGSRRAQKTHKNRKKLIVIFWSAGPSLLRADGFSKLECPLRRPRDKKWQFLIIKNNIKISAVFISSIFGHQTLDPHPDSLKCWIQIHNTAFRYRRVAYRTITTGIILGQITSWARCPITSMPKPAVTRWASQLTWITF